jgi:zona occludens toxin
MASTYVTGAPRSGKTFYTVSILYDMYKYELHMPYKVAFLNNIQQYYRYYISKPKNKNVYRHVYTNINKFNFAYAPQFCKLDFDDLRRNLAILYDINVVQKKDDDELNKVAKELGLFEVFIVIDEVHNLLPSKDDPVLVWWITYHGHMYQDLHFITQDMDLVHKSYKSCATFFYRVYPANKSIFANKFTIGKYSSSKYTQKSKDGDFTIPFRQEVFDLYVSGKAEKRATVLKKFVPIFIFLIIFLLWSISSFFGNATTRTDEKTDQLQNEKVLNDNMEIEEDSQALSREDDTLQSAFVAPGASDDNNTIDKVLNYKELSLLEIKCIDSNCFYKNIKIPKSFLLFILDHNNVEYSNINDVTSSYSIYTILLSDEIKNMLLKDSSKTKKKKSVRAKPPSSKPPTLGFLN